MAELSDLLRQARPEEDGSLNDDLPGIPTMLARKIPSKPGYLSLVRVAFKDDEAEPIMISGAGILSSVPGRTAS